MGGVGPRSPMMLGDSRLSARFWTKVRQSAETGCWVWEASRTTSGYGKIAIKRKAHTAHRVSYQALVGPIPAGLELDHLCRNRACVNPEHLEPVTRQVNLRRGTRTHLGARQRSKTHCPRGHEYAGANLYVTLDGKRRVCKTCARDRMRVKARREQSF